MVDEEHSAGLPGVIRRWCGRPPAFLAALALFFLVLAVFWPALDNGFINYDDPYYVTENPQVHGGLTWPNVAWAFTTTTIANWHPLTWLSHMLDCELYGPRAGGHHLTSLLFHAANTGLLFLVLRRLTGATWRSWAVAVLFGIHPLRVESVAWISERKDVLSTFFGLLAIWAYAAGNLKSQISNLKFIGLSAFLYTLSLMSKPMLVTLPFLLLLLDFWPLERWPGTRLRRLILEKIPFFALAVASSVITLWAQREGNALVSLPARPLGLRFENAALSYVGYLGKLFWPDPLAVFYPETDVARPLAAGLAALFLAIVTALCVVFWRRRYLPVGWFWYLGTLVPVIGIVAVGGQSMADRYTYFPCIGVLVLVVWAAADVARSRLAAGAGSGVLLVPVLALLAITTRNYLACWVDSETLFRHVTAVTRDNYAAHANLGNLLVTQGRIDEAIVEFKESLRLRPGAADTHSNFGAALGTQGRLQEALQEFDRALELDPNYSQAHFNRGRALEKLGNPDEAIREYRLALKLYPDFPMAYKDLARLLAAKGNAADAEVVLENGIRLNPMDTEALLILAELQLRSGRPEIAFQTYAKAVQSDPESTAPRNAYGMALAGAGKPGEAVAQFEAAAKLDPADDSLQNNLGIALNMLGRTNEAVARFQEAVRLNPNNDSARSNLQAVGPGGAGR
ncbi:MAG: tetratricopeptide repeat protein [Verrucomicrobiota bacterium]